MSFIIRVKDLTVKFNGKVLYENLCMNVEKGQKVTISGESGSGKTTLINILLGFMPFWEGEIEFFNRPLSADNIQFIRGNVSYVPQEFQMYSDSVAELIEFPFRFRINRSIRPSRDKIVEQLASLNLEEHILSKRPDEISGGERQRIFMAQALLLEKPLLILDEPTSALDVGSIEKIAARVLKNNDLSILSTSHNQIWLKHSEAIYNLDRNG
jgi:putative ABC transport system ATP-binding protein